VDVEEQEARGRLPGVRRLPEVVAHRGASAHASEHTVAAYERAIADGADALECDVRLTIDDHLVCVHDRRVERTSNGSGAVSALSLAELDAFDWGRDRPVEPPVDEVLPERHELLTLRRLCEVVASAGRPVGLAVETKHPTRSAALVERELVRVLEEFGWTEGGSPVRVWSTSDRALRRVHRLAPHLPTGLVLHRLPLRLRPRRPSPDLRALVPSVRMVRADPDFIARAHASGRQVHVYTVDTAQDAVWCAENGVDAVITNRPRPVREVLTRWAQG
jgi:glycerophosphoryl diester phosphodiesterase